jgi:hypothetical protein
MVRRACPENIKTNSETIKTLSRSATRHFKWAKLLLQLSADKAEHLGIRRELVPDVRMVILSEQHFVAAISCRYCELMISNVMTKSYIPIAVAAVYV